MPTATAERLRALADYIESEGIAVSSFAAAGDAQHVVLILKTPKNGGDEIIDMMNRKDLKPRQQRLRLDADAQEKLL